MGIKETVKEWIEEQWKKWVRDPIARKTEELENSATQQFNKYKGKAQEQINKHSNQVKTQLRKPGDYYWKQDTFYRGLFWIAVGCLIVLWIISGS